MATSQGEPKSEQLPDVEAYALRFESSRRALVEALKYRESRFLRLSECLGELTSLMQLFKVECEAGDDDWHLSSLDDVDRTLQRRLRLSLIVFGRSNTGKSTLLNQLLRDWPGSEEGDQTSRLFPTADHVCTARVTSASHGQAKTVSVVDVLTNQSLLEETPFKDVLELRKHIDLKGSERLEQKGGTLVRITVPNELLRHNLQLVDSPGMGEDAQMNEAVRSFLNSVESAVVIYVMDGTVGYLPIPDSENIKFLLEQHNTLQKIFIANRIDCDIKSYANDKSDEDLDEDIDFDDQEALIKYYISKGFEYSEHCRKHTLERMKSVRKEMHKMHPGCIDHSGSTKNEVALLGLSAKSVKDFLSKKSVLHAPYLDSFLELEAHITALIYTNGRQQLREAMSAMKSQMMLAFVHLLVFKLSASLRSMLAKTPMELMSRALRVINASYERITKAIHSLSSDESLLDLSNPNSDLNQLKAVFVRDGAKSEVQVDASLAMRKAEGEFIKKLNQDRRHSSQSLGAIRLLCNFKDAVASQLGAKLKSGYQHVFVGLILHQATANILDGSSDSLEDCKNDMTLIASVFEPNDTEFSALCASSIANGMREALERLVASPEFTKIVTNRTPDQRSQLLNYFLTGVELKALIDDVTDAYCGRMRKKKEDIEKRLEAQLRDLQQRTGDQANKLQRLKPLKRKLTVFNFFLDGLATELDWTASFDTRECEGLSQHYQLISLPSCPQLSERDHRELTPKINGARPAELLCRGLRLPADCLKRFAKCATRVRTYLPDCVQFQWLCLDGFNYGSSSVAADADSPDGRLLLAVVNREAGFRALAELQPGSISESDRLAWLHSLLMCYARVQSVSCHYRPLDYSPTNVLIVSGPPSSETEAGSPRTVAMPDPTYLLASEGQAADSASLAACIVTLFAFAEDTTASGFPLEQAWKDFYQGHLRRAVANPESFLAYLPSCLGACCGRSLVSCIVACASACLAASEPEKIAAQAKEVQRLLLPRST